MFVPIAQLKRDIARINGLVREIARLRTEVAEKEAEQTRRQDKYPCKNISFFNKKIPGKSLFRRVDDYPIDKDKYK